MLKLLHGRLDSPVVRVLILEECAVTTELLTRELERFGMTLVSERADSERAFSQSLQSFAPDLILSTPSIHDLDARQVVRLVQNLRPVAAVIVVAEHLDEQSCVAYVRAGAETVVLTSNLSRLGPAAQKALEVRQPLRKLSRRQLEVLRLVTDGCTSKEIGSRLGLSIKTVETHRGAGMRRLGIEDVAGLVRYAVRVGLIAQSPATVDLGSGAPLGKVAASGQRSALHLAAD
jgi:DNA-binding NarL/FixJ family response regulator